MIKMYEIVRFYERGDNRIIQRGLNLEQLVSAAPKTGAHGLTATGKNKLTIAYFPVDKLESRL